MLFCDDLYAELFRTLSLETGLRFDMIDRSRLRFSITFGDAIVALDLLWVFTLECCLECELFSFAATGVGVTML